MIATMATAPPLYTSRNMNSAGAPLPLIPRRISSGPPRTASRSAPSSPPEMPAPIKLVARHDDSSDSSSSSSPGPATTRPRVKRVRGVRTLDHSTPTSATPTAPTPTPTRPPLIYTPGVSLRLTTEHLKTRNFSESHAHAPLPSPRSHSYPTSSSPSSSAFAVPTSQSQPRLIRKKSGQLVKSSLKPSKSLSVVTSLANSRSEPATPTHTKAVHFPAKLEQVKLFLAEQKPLAVSRDGSPTDDTSGTDTDFPSFIFGSSSSSSNNANNVAPRKSLVMHTPNMPLRPAGVVDLGTDVLLEELTLAPDNTSIRGVVRVRNLAYSKWVVARFTFDAWQTTSEVTARYLSSPSPLHDVFVFTVRLNDLLPRIEGKRMWLAVRYSLEGREVWDNNGGRDYLAEFSVVKQKREEGVKSTEARKARRMRKARTSSDDDDESSPAESVDLADLRSELEKVVVQPQQRSSVNNNFLVPTIKLSSSSSSSSASSPPRTLGSRYDFAEALPWKPRANFDYFSSKPTHNHTRTQSYPTTTTQRPKSFPAATPPTFSYARPPYPSSSSSAATTTENNSIPWPEKAASSSSSSSPAPLGSPRDIDDNAHTQHVFFARRGRALDDSAAPSPTTPTLASGASGDAPGARRHRRGYFGAPAMEMEDAGVRRTPSIGERELDAGVQVENGLSDVDVEVNVVEVDVVDAEEAEEMDEVEVVLQPHLDDEVDVEVEDTPVPGRSYAFPPPPLPFLSLPQDDHESEDSSLQSTPSLSSSRDSSPGPSPAEPEPEWAALDVLGLGLGVELGIQVDEEEEGEQRPVALGRQSP
ncbi:hypothetical protein DXG03_007892, partial [Asterophora parasitica]